uniref:Doublesex-and mab-3-related transcription factor 1 n=2 Tax=Aceria tosichella TaxID=561515 RepID=A0A6G1SDW5_9ACAR
MIRSVNEENKDNETTNAKTDLRLGVGGVGVGGGGDNKSKRNPFCSRCRNHGKIAQVKGHKRHCEYRECQCYGCKLVEQRQHISAQQIKMRRNQKQDEEYGRRIEISPPVIARQPPDTTEPAVAAAAVAAPLIRPIGLDTVTSSIMQNSPLNNSATLKPNIINHKGPPAVVPTFPSQLYSHLQDHHHHLNAIPTTQPVSIAEQSAIISNSTSQNNNLQATDRHQQQYHHHHLSQQHHLGSSTKFNAPATTTTMDTHHQQCIMNPLRASSNGVSSLNSGLQLFQFPRSVLDASVAANTDTNASTHHHQAVKPVQSAVSSILDVPGPNSSLPSPSEQLHLLDEIHQTYGPLAIYAWLRIERFDRQRIGNLIELARSSYNGLVWFSFMLGQR